MEGWEDGKKMKDRGEGRVGIRERELRGGEKEDKGGMERIKKKRERDIEMA